MTKERKYLKTLYRRRGFLRREIAGAEALNHEYPALGWRRAELGAIEWALAECAGRFPEDAKMAEELAEASFRREEASMRARGSGETSGDG